MTKDEQLLRALDAFKDWSNYLLVTTVVALGWTATNVTFQSPDVRAVVVLCLTMSIVFGILTLALVPLVAEQLTAQSTSIYEVAAEFRIAWMWWPGGKATLKWVCWPQHVLFLVGILTFGIAAARNYITPPG